MGAKLEACPRGKSTAAAEPHQDRSAIAKGPRSDRINKRRVVWHRPGAIGDVLMTLQLVKLYKAEHRDNWVIYKTAPAIVDMLRPIMLEAGVDQVATTAELVACDHQFDLIGYPFAEGYPEKPMARHLIEYFSDELGLGGRCEDLHLKLPQRIIDRDYITLHVNAAWSMYKNWPLDRWNWICQELKRRGIAVVQIGGAADPAVAEVELNRLGVPFNESLGLLANAQLHVGIDSWSNHATNIVWQGKGKVPGVILWGSSQLSATGYPQNRNIQLGLPCQPCFREDPKISRLPLGVCPNPAGQTYQHPVHACMHGISRDQVLNAIVDAYIPRARRSLSMLSSAAARCDAGAASPAANDSGAAAAATETIGQPASGAATIGLCMIVKNEAAIIGDCLTSALPLLDYVLVVDTGSADGTQQIVRQFLAEHKVRGQVLDEPWRDFAYNRTFALECLRRVGDIDYALIIDADDLVVFDSGFDPKALKSGLVADFYYIQMVHANVTHFRPQICRNRLAFSFKGVVHEYLQVPPGELASSTANGFSIHANASAGSGRSQNPHKYQDDAALLEATLRTESDPFLISRYTFYLAQSYKDCGEPEKALANYLKRAELGYWSEEVYISLCEAGHLMAALGRPFDAVIAVWERASQIAPARAEALQAASHHCRQHGRNREGQEFARRGRDLTPPAGALFLQPWVYDYGILDEFTINAYWAGDYQASLDAALTLLAREKLPAGMVTRIAASARFAAAKLPNAMPPNRGRLGAETLVTQHALVPQRALRSRLKEEPRVLVAILALQQQAAALPLYLDCIAALDYPKSALALYIRTDNQADQTEAVLRDWVAGVGHLYHTVDFATSDVTDPAGLHDQSLQRALELGCEFYFVAGIDNFVRRAALRELVALDLPIVAPLLRSTDPRQFYANYHAEVDRNGYYADCDQYQWILNRHIRGIVEAPVVNGTYLVRADTIPELGYADGSGRHDYVIFSDRARNAGIPQYLDNRQVYGYIGNLDATDSNEHARALLHRVRAAEDTAATRSESAFPAPVVSIAEAHTEQPLTQSVKAAFDSAMAGQGKLDARLLSLEGSSGRKYRLFINTLIGLVQDARYLEIGCYTGSTLCSAIAGNAVSALVIDNWSQFGGPVEQFMRNVARFRGPAAPISILENDFRAVDYAHIGRFNLFMFDGPHSEADHYDAIDLALPALDDSFVLVVDDWDWTQVRGGTERAIADRRLTKDLWIEIRTTLDGTTPAIGGEHSDWHNGYLLAVLSKPGRAATQLSGPNATTAEAALAATTTVRPISRVRSMPYRFHILGVPHTISVREYSACAFTQKVVKLCKMLKARGHSVFHYGHEDSSVECDEHITVTKRYDLEKSYGDHDWRRQGFPPYRLDDHVYKTFFAKAIAAVATRKQPGDFLLCPFGSNHKAVADAHPDMIVCEPGIGYPDGGFAKFRVFESYSILHAYLGQPRLQAMSNKMWYDVVIPNYFDIEDFEFSANKDDYFLFIGRINPGKGIHIAMQIVDAVGGRLVVAGAGELMGQQTRTERAISEYVELVGVVGPEQRRQLMAQAKATLAPSLFLEPFCGVQIESMLSGTPVISTDWGAFAEYNLHGITGYRCRTFEHFTWAARNIHTIDPHACRVWSEQNFALDRVADMYDEYFFSVRNIFSGNGWYQENAARFQLDWLYKFSPDHRLGSVDHALLPTDIRDIAKSYRR